MNNPFDEAMEKVRTNLEMLYARLISLGYRFSNPDSALLSPDSEAERHIRFLEEKIGKVPLSLVSFYRVVGSVDFTGRHPDTGVFRIPIAPDCYHKEDVSGGMWYGVEVPNGKDDPVLLEEWHHTTFVGYLRLCFEWGGFPGLERAGANHTWPLTNLKQGLAAI